MSDLEFYNKQDKEELVSMCIARDNKINSLEQENKQLKELKKQLIEYIKYNLKSFIYSKEYKDLLEILGDKENE
jgi:hypothetical protein